MKALSFNNSPIHISCDAWFSATDMANVFGKRVSEWLRLPETQRYINQLCEIYNVEKSYFIKTRKGKVGGIWFHRKLAIRFAEWLDIRLAIWCDERIEEIMSSDWQQSREDTKASTRMMNRMLHVMRQRQGKESKSHHYSNEVLLCYEVLTGKREKCDRDNLTSEQLKRLTEIEIDNSALLGMGMPYHERKAHLLAKQRINLGNVAL